jgi:hypothetical protein
VWSDYQIPLEIQDYIIELLKNEVGSARVMCELLIKERKSPNERYITRKPKIYASVCSFLGDLVDQGVISFEESFGMEDRVYKFKE